MVQTANQGGMPGSIRAFRTVRDFKSLQLRHGSFMAAAVKAVTCSSPTRFGIAPYRSHPPSLHKRLSASDLDSPLHPPGPLTERDDKRMSKHAVASLGQRAQTLAPAVENGGEEAEQKASELGESVQ